MKSSTASVWLMCLVLAVSSGLACSSEPDGGASNENSSNELSQQRPLQPLIYTEHPNVDPEAVAVRERRLMRRLLDGADESGRWGNLRDRQRADLPRLTDADALGRAVFEALVERDAALWDRVFVAPVDYARMVHVDTDTAREYVDGVQARSQDLWRKLGIERASEAPSEGVESVFEYRGMELGEGRTLDGPLAEEDEYVAQHWGNKLQIGLVDSDVVFELTIRKILRAPNSVRGGAEPVLGIASPLTSESRFDVFLGAGLHLKEQLLETHEYPIPLKVGNYWRYRRSLIDGPKSDEGPGRRAPSAGLIKRDLTDQDEQESRQQPRMRGLAATEALLEVVSVERFGTRRLVHLRRSYNDEKLRTIEQYWMLTPRRIFFCNRACRRNFEDVGWLLVYMRRQTPIFTFPLETGSGWRSGGRSANRDDATFWVRDDWSSAEVSAGTYDNVLIIDGLGPYSDFDRYLRGHQQARVFAHGEGIVRRRLEGKSRYEAGVVEELVESRLMP